MLEVNLKNRATMQHTRNFNSMCNFGNTSIGVNSSGIFVLGGYNDAGVEIPMLLRSGMFDLGTERDKRIRFFYFGITGTGDLKLSIFCNGTLADEYTVNVASSGVANIRRPISRMYHGRYWQWQVENVDGAFAALYSVKVLPVIL